MKRVYLFLSSLLILAFVTIFIPQTQNLSLFKNADSGEIVQCSEIPTTMGAFFKSECRDSYIHYGHDELGPVAYLRSNSNLPKRKIADIKSLKIMGQNFENLGTFIEKQRDSNGEEKEVILEKPDNLKHAMGIRILKQNPDIIVGAEVKDIQTATDYAEKYLQGLYQAILIEGNDQRGIDLCFFIKKDLPLDIQVQSHKEIPTPQNKEVLDPLFSRDLPVLLIRNANAPAKSEPLMIIAGVHYKAQMPDPAKDQKALVRRSKQVKGTLDILNGLKSTYTHSPIFVLGDFNNDIRNSPEFQPFYDNNYVDSMNIAKDSPPVDQRGTQYFFFPKNKSPQAGQLSNEQLDVVFTDPNAQKYITSAGIQRDVDENGVERLKPKTSKEVNLRASDHDGVYAIINFEQLFQDYQDYTSSGSSFKLYKSIFGPK